MSMMTTMPKITKMVITISNSTSVKPRFLSEYIISLKINNYPHLPQLYNKHKMTATICAGIPRLLITAYFDTLQVL